MARLGDAVLIPKPGTETPHLWIIVTVPEAASGRAVMVNLTTQRPHSDTTVVLNTGDHPFVRHSTVVNDSDARFVDVRQLELGVRAGYFTAQATCTGPVLERIQAGIFASRFTPMKIQIYCRNAELLP